MDVAAQLAQVRESAAEQSHALRTEVQSVQNQLGEERARAARLEAELREASRMLLLAGVVRL